MRYRQHLCQHVHVAKPSVAYKVASIRSNENFTSSIQKTHSWFHFKTELVSCINTHIPIQTRTGCLQMNRTGAPGFWAGTDIEWLKQTPKRRYIGWPL